MKKTIIFILICLMLFTFPGCKNKEYEQLYTDFKNLYLEVTKDINLKEPYVTMEQFNQEAITSKLQTMKEIESKMKKLAENEREQSIYGNVNSFLNVLESLQYAAKDLENLTEEERGQMDMNLASAVMYRKSIEDGDV